MEAFISEPLKPIGSADTAAMARGEPGLPPAFEWRGRQYPVAQCLERWKQSSPEGGRAGNEVYLRRHYYRLKMSDGTTWTVYFARQAPRGGSRRQRWFLYGQE